MNAEQHHGNTMETPTERDGLITKLRFSRLQGHTMVYLDSLIVEAADMLEADAQEIAGCQSVTDRNRQIIDRLLAKIEAQQAAVPSRFTSVTEGLPEPDATSPKEYLVQFDCGGETRHAIAYYLLGDYADPTRRHWSGHGGSHNSVLAWAPILAAPQPPQGEVE